MILGIIGMASLGALIFYIVLWIALPYILSFLGALALVILSVVFKIASVIGIIAFLGWVFSKNTMDEDNSIEMKTFVGVGLLIFSIWAFTFNPESPFKGTPHYVKDPTVSDKTYSIKSDPNELFFEKIPDGCFCYTFINNSDYQIKEIWLYSYRNKTELIAMKEPLDCGQQIDIVSPKGKYDIELFIFDPETKTTRKLNDKNYLHKFKTKFGNVEITNDGINVTEN